MSRCTTGGEDAAPEDRSGGAEGCLLEHLAAQKGGGDPELRAGARRFLLCRMFVDDLADQQKESGGSPEDGTKLLVLYRARAEQLEAQAAAQGLSAGLLANDAQILGRAVSQVDLLLLPFCKNFVSARSPV